MATKKEEPIYALEATKYIWNKMTFGSLIRSLRTCDEITQVDLAKKLKVSKQFLNDVENNRKEVGMDFAKKVAKVMGYPIEPFIILLIRGQLRRQKLYYDVDIKKAS
jgi:transcriptional regulator with XRE-family HTH domain